MRKFFESGFAFMIVALLCFAAAVVSENGGAMVGVGGFWLVMAIITRAKFERGRDRDGDG